MENQHLETSDQLVPGQTEGDQFYLDHLSKIYYTYSHLNERLSEIKEDQQFDVLSLVINDLVIRSANQLELLERIYRLIGQTPDFSRCAGLTQFLEDNFDPVQRLFTPGAVLKFFMLSYLQYSNSILLTSFGLIQPGIETAFSAPACHLISSLFLLAKKENTMLSVVS